ncbi:MAG: peptide chain release factor N(5)-glutamine methyltransferase [Nitrospirae bacterium]|nr:peptide chain release factor N(5)-glutamine methyltransferase [Nitrospirota bacterium]
MYALDKIKRASDYLAEFDIKDAYREAELIVTHCLNINRIVLYKDNPDIPESIDNEIEAILKRRSKREPLQYILGYTEFYGLKIEVGPGVLIPRPETELLVEEAVKRILDFRSQNSNIKVLDLCTGSGCIALAIASVIPEIKVYGIDNSSESIKYALKNAKINNIQNVTFFESNLYESIGKDFKFDLIVSNPPYIKKSDLSNLQPDIKDWEPLNALDGGNNGLDYYRIIIPDAKDYLKKNGYIILEIGMSQAESIRKIAEIAGFTNITLIKDYLGIERIFTLKLNK